ncbi:MAG: cytochrome c [Akkermansiaceae bacterium]|nr:cytochrome c [Akkermansiaceae bacterium]
MKKTLLIVLYGLVAIIVAACTPAITDGGYGPVPTDEMARLSGRDLTQLQQGYVIYQKQCQQCHPEPLLPHEVSEGDWHIVVPGMAWNAGINHEEEEAVLQYLLAARRMPVASEP